MPDATTGAGTGKVTQPRPQHLNRFFTDCPQDWFIMIVRGSRLHKIIHSVEGWKIDGQFEFQRGKELFSPLMAATGYDFVGIPPFQSIYVYEFAWNKFWRSQGEQGKEEPEYKVVAHEKEMIFTTPFESQYPLRYGGIDVFSKASSVNNGKKDGALIPITLTVTVRVRIRRPRVALMTNIDWFGQVLTPNIQRAIKEFVGDKDYDSMIRDAHSRVSRDFSETFLKGRTKDDYRQIILDNAGVEIIDIGIVDIEPNKQFEDALLAQAVMEREAKARIIKAEGEKQAKILEGEAEKEYQRLVGEGNAARILAEADAEMERIRKTSVFVAGGHGDLAAMIEKWRQIHNSGLTTYVEGGTDSKPGILVGSSGKPIS